MSDNTIQNQFYLFISKFGSDNNEVIQNIDSNYGNKDGVLIKSEFSKCFKQKWNGEQSDVKDLIDKFWDMMDTNKTSGNIGNGLQNYNALTAEEVSTNIDNTTLTDSYNLREKTYKEVQAYIQEHYPDMNKEEIIEMVTDLVLYYGMSIEDAIKKVREELGLDKEPEETLVQEDKPIETEDETKTEEDPATVTPLPVKTKPTEEENRAAWRRYHELWTGMTPEMQAMFTNPGAMYGEYGNNETDWVDMLFFYEEPMKENQRTDW